MSAAQVYVDRAKNALHSLDVDLNLKQYELLTKAEQKTGQPRSYLLLGTFIVLFVLITALFGVSFISNLFAFYPLYSSFKALRSPLPEDDQFWLTYWVVFATLALFESLIDGVFFWLPFYYVIKVIFLIWCFHPDSKGALIVYKRILAPLFVGVQREIQQDIQREGETNTNTKTNPNTTNNTTTTTTTTNTTRNSISKKK